MLHIPHKTRSFLVDEVRNELFSELTFLSDSQNQTILVPYVSIQVLQWTNIRKDSDSQEMYFSSFMKDKVEGGVDTKNL